MRISLSSGPKLVALLSLSLLLFAIETPLFSLALLFALILLALQKRFSDVIAPFRSLLPFLLSLFAMQWWSLGLEEAAIVSIRLVAMVLAATLFTLTTPIS